MICWWCANLSFWGAAGLLGLLALVQALTTVRSSRHPGLDQIHRRAGQPAR